MLLMHSRVQKCEMYPAGRYLFPAKKLAVAVLHREGAIGMEKEAGT